MTYRARVATARRAILREAITAHRGNVSAAARALGVNRTYLIALLRQWLPVYWARRTGRAA